MREIKVSTEAGIALSVLPVVECRLRWYECQGPGFIDERVKWNERREFFCVPQVFRFEGIVRNIPKGGFQADHQSNLPAYSAKFHNSAAGRAAWTRDEVVVVRVSRARCNC